MKNSEIKNNNTTQTNIDDGIFICNYCKVIHSFQIYFNNNNIKFKFECPISSEEYDLNFLLENVTNFYLKCLKCFNILKYEEKIYRIDKQDKFLCENCKNESYKINKLEVKFNNKHNYNILEKIDNLYSTITEEQSKNELFDIYKKKIISLKNFIRVILYNYTYDYLEERNFIFENFFECLQKFIEIILENQYYYDVYTIINELTLYGNKYEYKFESNEFYQYYHYLILNCSQQKYLSLLLYDFIKKKYGIYSLNISNLNVNREYMDNFYFNCNIYNDIIKYINKKKEEQELLDLKSSILKINNENALHQYYLSYFEFPSQIILKKKLINIVLFKIISENYKKFDEIIPTKNMIKTILKEINILKKSNISKELIEKLNIFNDKLLLEYGYLLPNWRNKNKNSQSINHPYINFTSEEIKILKEKKNKKIQNQEFKRKDTLLQLSIDFLFYLKEKGNNLAHLIDSSLLNHFVDIQKLINLKFNCEENVDNLELTIKKEIKVEYLENNISLEDIVNCIFDVEESKSVLTEKNKVDFILEKYYKYLDKFLKSKDSYKILTQELSDKENQINESLNLLNNLEEDINLFNQYEKIFKMKNCYNDILIYFNALLNSNIIELIDVDKLPDLITAAKYNIKIQNLYKYKEFYTFEKVFLQYLLSNKIKENKEIILTEIKTIHENRINKYLFNEKLNLINKIVNELDNFSFKIKDTFNDFIKENISDNPNKKRKIGENEEITMNTYTMKDIFSYIINKINKKENINLIEEENRDFIFQCFKLKIGYPL